MSILPFLIFTTVSLVIFVQVFKHKECFIEYPWLVSFLAIAWFIPQGISVEKTSFASNFQSGYYWAFGTLCVLAVYFGFKNGRRNKKYLKARNKAFKYDAKKLSIFAFLMTIVGGLMLRVSVGTASDAELGQQWTGIATFYFLLSQLLYYGVALSALVYMRTRSNFAGFVLLVGLSLTLPSVLGMVKRNIIFELFIIVLGATYFIRRYIPPRTLVGVVAIFGVLLLHQTGSVRNYMRAYDSTFFQALVYGQALSGFQYFELERAPEVEEGIYDFYYARELNDFNFGADWYNRLVHQYVPAFLVGRELKESLKIEVDVKRNRNGIIDLDYPGATRTGFADTFVNFWWFGVVVFYGVGWFMGVLMIMALKGDYKAQYLYILLLNDGLFLFTDSSARYISGLPFLLIVGLVVFRSATVRTRTSYGLAR